jgi:hypothetical protein
VMKDEYRVAADQRHDKMRPTMHGALRQTKESGRPWEAQRSSGPSRIHYRLAQGCPVLHSAVGS